MHLLGIKTIIWDFDGVFYDYENIPKGAYEDLCDKASAEAACSILKGMDYQTAINLARKSYKDHHDGISSFIPLAPKYGLSCEDFQLKMYNQYHLNAFTTGINKYPHLFKPANDTIQGFNNLSPHVTHAILTHSCPEHWTKPILGQMQALPFFNDNHIIGPDSFNFVSKAKKADGISLMFNKLSANPARTLFVEDTLINLQVAKAAHPDLRTVWKTSQNVPLPDGVDFIVRNPADLMQRIKIDRDNNKNPPPNPYP